MRKSLLGAAVLITIAGIYVACSSDSDNADDTASTTTDSTIGAAAIGKLAITCGSKSCVGTEGE